MSLLLRLNENKITEFTVDNSVFLVENDLIHWLFLKNESYFCINLVNLIANIVLKMK